MAKCCPLLPGISGQHPIGAQPLLIQCTNQHRYPAVLLPVHMTQTNRLLATASLAPWHEDKTPESRVAPLTQAAGYPAAASQGINYGLPLNRARRECRRFGAVRRQ